MDSKIKAKLRLHKIRQVKCSFTINFQNDKSFHRTSMEEFKRLDDKIPLLTHVVSLRWTFVFDPEDDKEEHIHSVSVRIAERPNPGVLFQRFLSAANDDLDSLEGEAFAPISCKVDFLEGRFSSELLSVVAEWVKALPKAEPTFGAIRWFNQRSESIQRFIYGTFPPLMMLSAVGVWMVYLPAAMTGSIKVAVAWLIFSATVFLFARYVAVVVNGQIEKQLHKICNVPVFQLTSGDKNKMTKYLARSQRSIYALGGGGLVFGIAKGIGLWLVAELVKNISIGP